MDTKRLEIEATGNGYDVQMYTRADDPDGTPSVTLTTAILRVNDVNLHVESSCVLEAEHSTEFDVNYKRDSSFDGDRETVLEVEPGRGGGADATIAVEQK